MDNEEMTRWMKKLSDQVFGKTKPFSGPILEDRVYPLADILETLTNFSDEDWCAYSFSREPLRDKIPQELRLKLLAKANACGIEYAERYIEKYHTRDPKVLGEKLGIVIKKDDSPQNPARVLLAEFREPNKIFIHMEGVEKGMELCKNPRVRKALGENLDLLRILLSHELFHFIEIENKKKIFTEAYRLQLWKLGPLQNNSPVSCISEIAAMAFAKHLTGLSFSPFVMDVLFLYGYDPVAACRVYREMIGISNWKENKE